MTPATLHGQRVLVTRAAAQAAPLSSALRAAGADPVEVPLIAIEVVASAAAITAAATRLRSHRRIRWAVFTSANAVGVVAGALTPRELDGCRVAAVGAQTAAALASWGLGVDLVPTMSSGAALAAELVAGGVADAAAWLPRAEMAGNGLPEHLATAGVDVHPQTVYRIVLPAGVVTQLAAVRAGGPLDAVTLTSESAVANLITALEGVPLDPATAVLCIGPGTAATAQRLGLRVTAVAAVPSVTALVEAVVDHLAEPQSLP